MPLPAQTLATIQAAGAAIFAVDEALKNSVQEYAEQVKAAMVGNPFDLSNDTLFEDWKTVARLAQAVTQIEAEFKKIYKVACDLSTGSHQSDLVMPALVAPDALEPSNLEMVSEIQATDAVVKKRSPKKTVNHTSDKETPRLSGNTLKLWERLSNVLTATDFVKINQSALATEIGLAKGSIGASIAKLVQTGHLSTDESGAFKLSASMVG